MDYIARRMRTVWVFFVFFFEYPLLSLLGFARKKRRVSPLLAREPWAITPSWPPSISLTALKSCKQPNGSPKGAAYPGEGSSDVSASKTAQGSPQLHGFRFVSFRRQNSLRTGEQKRSPSASGSAESLQTPTGSEEKGVPPKAGCGVKK